VEALAFFQSFKLSYEELTSDVMSSESSESSAARAVLKKQPAAISGSPDDSTGQREQEFSFEYGYFPSPARFFFEGSVMVRRVAIKGLCCAVRRRGSCCKSRSSQREEQRQQSDDAARAFHDALSVI
jgi:hypothetical protein